MHVTIERIVSGPLAQEMLQTHRELFDPLDDISVQIQSMPDDMFLGMLEDPAFIEFVGWTDDGHPDALIIATNDLDRVPWIRPVAIRRRYPQHAEGGRIYYVTCLQVTPRSQGSPLTKGVIHALSQFLAVHQGVVTFDTCQWDVDNVGLPQFISRWANEIVVTEDTELDAQRYYGYEVKGFRTDAAVTADERGVVIDLREPALDAERTTLPVS